MRAYKTFVYVGKQEITDGEWLRLGMENASRDVADFIAHNPCEIISISHDIVYIGKIGAIITLLMVYEVQS